MGKSPTVRLEFMAIAGFTMSALAAVSGVSALKIVVDGRIRTAMQSNNAALQTVLRAEVFFSRLARLRRVDQSTQLNAVMFERATTSSHLLKGESGNLALLISGLRIEGLSDVDTGKAVSAHMCRQRTG